MTVAPAPGAIGSPLARVEGADKVRGRADYAFERRPDGVVYAWVVQATIARGRVRAVDASEALAVAGALAVITHENAPELQRTADPELHVLQAPQVAYRGAIVALAVAETLEAAREAAGRTRVDYDAEPHDVVLYDGHPQAYAPAKVNAGYPTTSEIGDLGSGLAQAEVTVDATYETPAFHNNAMEPHATVARWEAGDLVLHDSTQGAATARATIAQVFGLEPERVRVISHHVGGAFGSKGTPRPQAVLAALAARVTGRPVKLALSRRQMFAFTGYRTPTIQRVRLGAASDGTLTAIGHDALSQSSTLREFTEQTATATRVMYAAPHRRTTHALVRLDVPTPSWMRAPGECPGMFALECALDELAVKLAMDPVALRVRNEPERHPEEGTEWSSRHLVECLRAGAERFGWDQAARGPRRRRDGDSWVGTGVASAMYPAYRSPSQAHVRADGDGTFVVRVAAADIGTGARTALTQIAADALGTDPGRVRVEIGDSDHPRAPVAGGSMGTASWGTAVHGACRRLVQEGGDEASYDSAQDVKAQRKLARNAFGAVFCEARVDAVTGEVRVTRLHGTYAAGRIVNPRTARSQLIGGLTMGLGMALHEESVMDREFGDYLNADLAQYHVPACADVLDVDATWIDEDDPELNPIGVKGIGEIGIVGTAAAVANAVFDATGVRVRRLPLHLEHLL